MNRSLGNIVWVLLGALLAWVIMSGLVAFGGVFLTGHIPFLGLGLALGCFGVFVHAFLIFINKKPAWWQVGLLFSIFLGTMSSVLGAVGGDHYPLIFMVFLFAFFFVFGSFIYLLVQKVVVDFLIDPL